MSSGMTMREQFEAEICGEKSKRSFEEKVKIVKYFLLNGEILFTYKSTSVVKCLFFLCDIYDQQRHVKSFHFTELLKMVSTALGKYSGEFMVSENICEMMKLIKRSSISSTDSAIISNLIKVWLGLSKDLDEMDQFLFCFDVLKNLNIDSFTSKETLSNFSAVLTHIIAILQDLSDQIDFGESAQNFSDDEKEILVDVMCQIYQERELLFLDSGDQFSNFDLKNCFSQMSKILQLTLFKDLVAVVNSKKSSKEVEAGVSDSEAAEAEFEKEDKKLDQLVGAKDLPGVINGTMHILDHGTRKEYMHASWLLELSNISDDKINPLPFITSIMDILVPSEEGPELPEEDLQFRCQCLANVLVAMHDSVETDKWSSEFDPQHLRGLLSKVTSFVSSVKKQLGFNTGESAFLI